MGFLAIERPKALVLRDGDRYVAIDRELAREEKQHDLWATANQRGYRCYLFVALRCPLASSSIIKQQCQIIKQLKQDRVFTRATASQ